MRYFDTSRAKATDDCPRKRWLNYEMPNGTPVGGIEPVRMALPLATGIYTHEGMAVLLTTGDVEQAVKHAVGEYRAEVASRGMDVEVADELAFTIDEQAALIEALVRAWRRARYDTFMAEYEVGEVEREEALQLGPDLTFMSRSDAILRRRSDSRLFILNFKTASSCGESWLRGWETDVQTMSETVTVERRLGEKVAGVLIEGLEKGKRERMDAEGRVVKDRSKPYVKVVQWSPLLMGYKLDGNPPLEPAAYSHEYTRAKGWHRFHVWQDGGIKWWVEEFLPIEACESVCVSVPPILRLESMVEDWLEQQTFKEKRVGDGVREIAERTAEGHSTRTLLNECFPQSFAACQRYSGCPFRDVCFTQAVGVDPIGSMLYRPRTPHHEPEEQLLRVEGGL